MFNPVNSRVSLPEMEEAVMKEWRRADIFKKSVENRKGGPRFVFYEGPPFANGNPGIHHVLARVYKDVMVRYKAMKGYYVPRIAGWDTHGLPVELEVEKKIGVSSKPEIEAYGIDRFNKMSRESVFTYLNEWNALTERIAYWVDLEHAYKTMDNGYIESVWWALKQMWDKGYVYRGYRVTPHCPRCGTSLSSHEVSQGYQEDTEDPSVYVRFRIDGPRPAGAADEGKPAWLLAWTTTPWTLPGNTALAVAAAAEYVVLENDSEYLVLANRLAGTLDLGGYARAATVTGQDLVGTRYVPLYNPHDYGVPRFRFTEGATLVQQEPDPDLRYPVIATDFVTMDDGSGIVHVAPAFGEVDYEAGKRFQLDFVQQVDLQGHLTGSYPWGGSFIKDADPAIVADLEARGQMFLAGTIRHTYPFCWRCDAPLVYYAKETWYIQTTAVKDRLLANNEQINWYPAHIKYGRFGDWLQNNIDWAFARERYWGTPLPIWRCGSCGHDECVGSVAELREKPGFSGLPEPLDLHRPYLDDVTFTCPSCGAAMKRTPEVMDCWFDSGSMPFAQLHYPAENRELFDTEAGQADYICEAIDQTRGWFYTLHAISTMLFDRPAFKNCVCLELVQDSGGKKMSKSRGNVVEPGGVISRHGADALRWYCLTGAPPGMVRRFDTKQVADVMRQQMMTLWNVYSFFVMYANIDGFTPATDAFNKPEAGLDRWILSELHQLVRDVTDSMESYNPTDAGRKLETFIDGLSNWYVRLSRRRFWKSENDADKLSAYNTLYTCLVTLARVMAPFAPFLAEELYRNLVLSADPGAPESIHLADFPVANESLIDTDIAEANRLAMKVCSMGRAARSQAKIKVRQPVGEIVVSVAGAREERALESVRQLVLEELNTKGLRTARFDDVVALDGEGYTVVTSKDRTSEKEGEALFTTGAYAVALYHYLTPELEAEGAAREISHKVQGMRRAAGYEIADHIVLYYEADAFHVRTVSMFADYLRQETLAVAIVEGLPDDADRREELRVAGYPIVLGVKKAA